MISNFYVGKVWYKINVGSMVKVEKRHSDNHKKITVVTGKVMYKNKRLFVVDTGSFRESFSRYDCIAEGCRITILNSQDKLFLG